MDDDDTPKPAPKATPAPKAAPDAPAPEVIVLGGHGLTQTDADALFGGRADTQAIHAALTTQRAAQEAEPPPLTREAQRLLAAAASGAPTVRVVGADGNNLSSADCGCGGKNK